MTEFFQYLVEVTLGTSILFMGFYLIRSKCSIQFRRFYLLVCLILPLILPLVAFHSPVTDFTIVPQKLSTVLVLNVEPDPLEILQNNTVIDTEEPTSAAVEKTDFDWATAAIILYCLVTILLIVRLSISLMAISTLIRNAHKNEMNDPYHIVNDHRISGGSFFGWIFINKNILSGSSMDIILAHEQVHVKRWHSVDILLSEIYCAVFWINPLAWMIKREIKLNIEHEADARVANDYGKEHYANMLLQLSVNRQNQGPILSFSAFHIRKRLHLIMNRGKHHWAFSGASLPFLVLAFWMISCEPEMMDFSTMDPQAAMQNVKTVTTRYISHQKDTQKKDGKVIAIAYYLPDGTVDRVEQHMTYPYDFKEPFEIPFLASPSPAGVLHILDGFNIGHAEKNILYGNDWPKYATKMFKPSELFNRSVSTENNSIGLPEKIVIKDEINEEMFKPKYKGSRVRTYTQNFTYSGKKVTSYSGNNGRSYAEYKYDGDRLIEVSSGDFYGSGKASLEYKGDMLVNSSFHKYGKKYNHREFHYNSDGLKTRTEIYNVYGEPEYTIIYDYEYY